MFYTVTFNPSLDYTVHLPFLTIGAINRTEREAIYPGGKGINVGIVLKRLGFPVRLLGFTAGFTGREIERLSRQEGCDSAFVRLADGYSRINVKIGDVQAETAVNGAGPSIPAGALQKLWEQIDALQTGDVLVLAGSIPGDLPREIYRQILQRTEGRKLRVVVDAEGEVLDAVIPLEPFLIKPNREELEGLLGRPLRSEEEIAGGARSLQKQGARNVLVSLGKDGALLAGEDSTLYRMHSPAGKAVNSVGAGDSMVAGFLAGYEKSGGNLRDALRYGIACGSATAFTDWLAERQEIEHLLAIV